ncbi:MAG: dihydrodipicolinate reductase C-terminal domain-containing protein [Holophaga sp.]|nr:dihydrodipicolinate reductase C-terminal domain-containing protein [Holophaga sp.]
MQVGIFGRGRLGSAIAQEVAAARDLELVWHLDKGEGPAPAGAELAFDASTAEAVPEHLDWALATGTDLVIATTNWTLPGLEARIQGRIAVLTSPNFSLAVALMARLSLVLGRFAALDPELDPYLADHHHRMKTDAPSGTAKRLAAAVMAGCPRKTEWTMGSAAPHQLSVSVLRAGVEFGTHTVGLDGPAEVLELTHRARSRAVFAQGALLAARWVRGRKGLFSFDDYAQETLDPLFQFGDPS